MLGTGISAALQQQGLDVLRLTRKATGAADEILWDSRPGGSIPEANKEHGRLEGLRAAVHLSGVNVASHRWTEAFKREMTESRVGSTDVLARALAGLRAKPEVLIAASAIGIYGDRGDEVLDEDSAPGTGFFPELCAAWEAAAGPALDAGIRVVQLRFGVVLGRGADGKPAGMLGKLGPLFRLGLGGRLGNGRQWLSWVSERDLVAAVLFLLDHRELAGPFNVTAPGPVTNTEFTRDLAGVVHRPAMLPAPAFALRLALGEMADEALLASTRAVPRRLMAAGFKFKHSSLREAIAEVVGDKGRQGR